MIMLKALFQGLSVTAENSLIAMYLCNGRQTKKIFDEL